MARQFINKVSHYARDLDGNLTIPKYRLNLTLSERQKTILNSISRHYSIQPSEFVRMMIESNGKRLMEKLKKERNDA